MITNLNTIQGYDSKLVSFFGSDSSSPASVKPSEDQPPSFSIENSFSFLQSSLKNFENQFDLRFDSLSSSLGKWDDSLLYSSIAGLGLLGYFVFKNTMPGKLAGRIALLGTLALAACKGGKDDDTPADDTGGGIPAGSISLSSAGAIFTGEAAGDKAGFSVAGAGDVNGDSYSDLLIGTIGAEAAYLVDGPVSGVVSLSDADAKFTGEAGVNYSGASVAGAGDMNNDGYDDMFIGAPNYNFTAGVAYLINGPVSGVVSLSEADAKLVGEEDEDDAGDSAGAGDINGDGNLDLLVGASGVSDLYYNAGAAYVVYGPVSDTISLSEADAKLTGEATSDEAGESVASADMNNDGNSDLLIGAPGVDNTYGAVYLVDGPVSGTASLSDADAKLTGEEQGSGGAGVSIASADMNDDGHADLLIGAPNIGTLADGGDIGHGGAYVVYGPISGTVSLSDADAKLTGEELGEYSGNSVATADMNKDGYADLLIGASGVEEYEGPGATYLFLGPVSSGTISLSESYANFTGEGAGDKAGWSVASAGDVDNNGGSDILIGAYGNNDYTGAAYLILSGI